MNKKIQTIIWAILLFSGIFGASRAEAQEQMSQLKSCQAECLKTDDNLSVDNASKQQTNSNVLAQRDFIVRDADSLKKINVGGTIGLFLPSDSDEFNLNNDDFDFDSFDFDAGFGGSIYGGYRFNNFLSADLEFVAFTGSAEPFDSDYTSVGFFLNPRYTLNLGSNPNASPYIFVSPGIGVAGVGFGDDLEEQISDDGLNTGVAIQIKAGAGLPLSESIDIFGQARYLNSFEVYEISGADDDEQSFTSFSLEAGLNFKL